MAGATEIYSKFQVRAMVRSLQAEEVSQSEIHGRSLIGYGQRISAERQSLCGVTNLKMAERH
jgi:hypothetical protein